MQVGRDGESVVVIVVGKTRVSTRAGRGLGVCLDKAFFIDDAVLWQVGGQMQQMVRVRAVEASNKMAEQASEGLREWHRVLCVRRTKQCVREALH